MTQQLVTTQIRVAAFDTVEEADRAVRRLLAAGFSKEQLAVVCPAKFKEHFIAAAPHAEVPSHDAVSTLATGGAVGATLGGLALAATVVTGGAAGLMAAAVLIGGGAIAGGFSNLIVKKGYEQEEDDFARRAIGLGKIVVGAQVPGEDGAGQLATAERILDEEGGVS